MSQPQLLKTVVAILNAAKIEYMVTGSVVSSLQGEPRSTHDIDLVVDLSVSQVHAFVAAFASPEYYLAESSVREAIELRSMFNLLAINEGDNVDFWMLTTEPFDQSRFARRKAVDFDETLLFVSAPEDTILAKLRWSKMSGGSEKQFMDALGIYELQYAALDQEYLNTWVKNLGVEELFARLAAAAKPLS